MFIDIEIWKDVVGWEMIYQASNLGRVKSLNYRGHGKEHVLKPLNRDNRYLSVILYKDGKGTAIRVHRLIAGTFIENPLKLNCVNHIDGNKKNNHVSNLEWCTHRHNLTHTNVKRKTVKTSKYIGASWNSQAKIWIANVRLNNKQYYLGRYKSELDAAKAYRIALKNFTEYEILPTVNNGKSQFPTSPT